MASIGLRGLAVAVLFVGCAGDTDENEAEEQDSAVVVVPNAPVRADTIAAGQTTSVNVVLDEWSVAIPTDTLPPGAAQFVIVNRGDAVHGFEVEGAGIEEEVEHIRPGTQATLTVNLRPGEYQLYCPVSDSAGNHEAKGMSRRITVRGIR